MILYGSIRNQLQQAGTTSLYNIIIISHFSLGNCILLLLLILLLLCCNRELPKEHIQQAKNILLHNNSTYIYYLKQLNMFSFLGPANSF